jgi:hypothetical protein
VIERSGAGAEPAIERRAAGEREPVIERTDGVEPAVERGAVGEREPVIEHTAVAWSQ